MIFYEGLLLFAKFNNVWQQSLRITIFTSKAMTTDPGSVPKGALPTLDDDYENDTEAVDRYT